MSLITSIQRCFDAALWNTSTQIQIPLIRRRLETCLDFKDIPITRNYQDGHTHLCAQLEIWPIIFKSSPTRLHSDLLVIMKKHFKMRVSLYHGICIVYIIKGRLANHLNHLNQQIQDQRIEKSSRACIHNSRIIDIVAAGDCSKASDVHFLVLSTLPSPPKKKISSSSSSSSPSSSSSASE